jgi:DNA-binding NtrC family response regulator
LVEAFLARNGADPSSRLHPAALAVLRTTDFEDNVRELEQVVLHALAVRRVGTIMPSDLPEVRGSSPRHLTGLQRSEREVIRAALVDAAGNKRAAAQALGISRGTLYKRIAEYRIES